MNQLKISNKTKFLIDSSVIASIGLVLSFFKIFTMPQGGSVTLAPLAIIVGSISKGFFVGFTSGILLGILEIMVGGYVIGFIQALLDYPLAYASLSITYFSPKNNNILTILAILLAFTVKLSLHVYSGYLFFNCNLKASLIYNLSFSLPEFALCTLVFYFLMKKNFLQVINKL